jgi:hypothetical protein
MMIHNKLFAAEVIDGKFRFLKAQGTAKVCLACHGKNISAEVTLFNCGFNVAPNFLTILIASLFNKEISTVA